MSIKAKITLAGGFPADARAVVVDYRVSTGYTTGSTWQKLGEYTTSEFTVTLPDENGAIEMRVRARNKKGLIVSVSSRKFFTFKTKVTDRVDPTEIDFPDPTVGSDPVRSTITVIPSIPKTEVAKEWVFEVRQSYTGAAPEDSLLFGDVNPGEKAVLSALPRPIQTIHSRPVRMDGKPGNWISINIETPPVAQEMVGIDDNTGEGDFTDVLVTRYGMGDPLEIDGRRLQFKETPSMWGLTGVYDGSMWGMTGEQEPPIWGTRDFFPYAEVFSDAYNSEVVHEFIPQTEMEIADFGYTGMYRSIWGDTSPFVFNPRMREFLDYLWSMRSYQMWDTGNRAGDNLGLECECSIAVSQDDLTGNFTPFRPIQPGARYRGRQVRYATKVFNRTTHRQMVIGKWHRRRLIRNKKWEYTSAVTWDSGNTGEMTYVFDPAPELTNNSPVVQVQVENSTYSSVEGVTYEAHIINVSRTQVTFSLTQVCHGTDTTAGGVGQTVTFAQPFETSSRPYLQVSPVNVGASDGYLAQADGTPVYGSFIVKIFDTANNAQNKDFDWVARGIPQASAIQVKIQVSGY